MNYWLRDGDLDDRRATWHYVVDSGQREKHVETNVLCGAIVWSWGWVYDNDAGSDWITTHRAAICLDCLDAMSKR